MIVTLSAPSKTFFLGEYLALTGGPSLVVNTGPRFQLRVELNGQGECHGIHPQSPAGQLIRQNNEDFRQVNLTFVDPHMGKGGLGGSTAQFLLSYVWSHIQQHSFQDQDWGLDEEPLWKLYRAIAWDGLGLKPSGADVVAQCTGGFTTFRAQPFQIQKNEWPFMEQGFFVCRTGEKLATHEYLQKTNSLDLRFLDSRQSPLREVVDNGVKALEQVDWEGFTSCVNQFGSLLREKGYITQRSAHLVTELSSHSSVAAVKACGAMGADTLLVLFEEKNVEDLESKLEELDLEVVGSHQMISGGVKVHWDLGAWKQMRKSMPSAVEMRPAHV